MMSLVQNDFLALALALLGAVLYGLLIFRLIRRSGVPAGRSAMVSLLPGVYMFLFAKAGYELLQFGEVMSVFRWCFTTGLLGLMAGTWHAARLCRLPALPLLDSTAPGLCAAMFLARVSQRWLGETGIGPWLEEDSFFCRLPVVMINDWQEPMLAIWMLEALAALIALAFSAAYARRSRRMLPGVRLSCTLALLTLPQVLLEQFRTGHYMRFRMMRLEQVLLALVALTVLMGLCHAFACQKHSRPLAAWWPVPVYAVLTAVIVIVQFVLDGKLFELPDAVSWCLYVVSLLGMLALCFGAAHRCSIPVADACPNERK